MPLHPNRPVRPRRPPPVDSRPSAGPAPVPTDLAQLLFTPKEAAALLRVRESWLRRQATARTIPVTFLGRHLRFSAANLAAIVAAASQPVGSRRRSRRHRPATQDSADPTDAAAAHGQAPPPPHAGTPANRQHPNNQKVRDLHETRFRSKVFRRLVHQLRDGCEHRGLTLADGHAEHFLAGRIDCVAAVTGVTDHHAMNVYLADYHVEAIAERHHRARLTQATQIEEASPVLPPVAQALHNVGSLAAVIDAATTAPQRLIADVAIRDSTSALMSIAAAIGPATDTGYTSSRRTTPSPPAPRSARPSATSPPARGPTPGITTCTTAATRTFNCPICSSRTCNA